MAKTSTVFRLSVVAAATLALLLTACGGGGGGSDSAPTIPTPPPSADTRKPVVTSLRAKVLGTDINIDLMASGVVGIPNNAIITADVDEVTRDCPTPRPVEGVFGDIAASFSCVNGPSGTTSLWTLVPTVPFSDGARLGLTLTPMDAAGNQGEFKTSFQAAFLLASVTLGATPDTIVVGQSATLTWAPTKAVNCVGSGGLSGSLDPAGGSVTVTPTVTTVYGIECQNGAGVSTGVKSATVTVTAAPVVTHPAAVVMFGPNWVHQVDPMALQGIAPIANNTGREFYSYGFRATALPDCRIQVSVLDNYTFAPFWVLYDRSRNEFTLDTSGTAPLRLVENYTFFLMPNPSFPVTETMTLVVGDERYFVLDTDHQSLRYQKGAAPDVLLGTYPLGIKALIAYPACTPAQ